MARMKRYDAGGRVSESEDVGTANARADQISAEQAKRDYGSTWIRNRAGTINPEPKISPLIQIYPAPTRRTRTEGSGIANYCKGGKVISSRKY